MTAFLDWSSIIVNPARAAHNKAEGKALNPRRAGG
jgi:hypothetical protein